MKKQLKKHLQMNYKPLFIVGMSIIITLFLINLISASVTDNLITYFKFDETTGNNLYNEINHSQNGTLNQMENSDWVTGKFSNGLIFDGINESVNFTRPSGLVNDTTISFWVNMNYSTGDYPSGIDGFFIFGGAGLGYYESSGIYGQYIWGDGVGASGNIFTNRIVKSLSTGIYNHIVITQSSGLINKSNSKIYINRILTPTSETPTYLQYLTGNFTIGNDYSAINRYINGTMDEFKIWNITLNSSEVAGLYSISDYDFVYDEIGFNNSVYESLNDTFSINVTSYKIPTDAYLNYNGTDYSASVNSVGNSSYIINKTINIPVRVGNNTFYFHWISESTTFNSVNNTQKVNAFPLSNITFNNSVYETALETFKVNIPITFNPTSAYLNYNGTDYSATITNTGIDYEISKQLNIPIPTVLGNNTFYFHWTSNSQSHNSTKSNQTINPVIFNICNSTLHTKFLNISFQDESSLTFINATIPSSTFQYYLGSGSVNKTITYTNNSLNYQYYFCANVNQTFKVNPYVQYKQGTDYPQRIWNPEATSYTNVTTNQILYLLSSTDGQYVTLQLVNSADQPINGVNVEVVSNGITVGSGLTGSDGGVTFWLNPDYLHTFTFTKTGYTTYETSFSPTQTSYTITLGSTSTSNNYDYTIGISYFILPSATYLDNDTTYSFNFTISSTYWSLDSYGFTLTLTNGSVLGSISDTTSTGGTINLNVNTLNDTSIRMDFYYVVNGSYQNMSKNWIIYSTEDNGFSIWFMINRFKTYMNSGDGIFGLKTNSFSLNLFIYVLILAIVGIMSYKFSVSSPATVLGMLFGLVALFDVVLGLLYNPPLAEAVGVHNFSTILIGIILFGVIIKEAYS